MAGETEKVEGERCDANGGIQVSSSVVGTITRKMKRKEKKKLKRKMTRKEAAEREREQEDIMMNDPDQRRKLKEEEDAENARMEAERKLFEQRERDWLEEMERKAREAKAIEEEKTKLDETAVTEDTSLLCDDEEDSGYAEEGPAEIIWKGNEIIIQRRKVKVSKKSGNHGNRDETNRDNDVDRPFSNPLPPQSVTCDHHSQLMLENGAEQFPRFGTEQDKAHCPFHFKTGACRFGQRCSRVHFYPDKACTLLIKNMYTGPGICWEQEEGLEFTDDEVERCFEEFYEDVHTEFLKYGELVNFKVCKNGASHLRGNVYAHFKSLDSAELAYYAINGRFFAGKQVKCEYVNITRWKVAICGEYMKSRYKTCSHGMACNFIHCFRNPGGDYEWADWDNPPPRYWIKEMTSLFGYSEEILSESQMGDEWPCSRGRGRGRARERLGERSNYHGIDRPSSNSTGNGSYQKKLHKRSHGQEHLEDSDEEAKSNNLSYGKRFKHSYSESNSCFSELDEDWHKHADVVARKSRNHYQLTRSSRDDSKRHEVSYNFRDKSPSDCRMEQEHSSNVDRSKEGSRNAGSSNDLRRYNEEGKRLSRTRKRESKNGSVRGSRSNSIDSCPDKNQMEHEDSCNFDGSNESSKAYYSNDRHDEDRKHSRARKRESKHTDSEYHKLKIWLRSKVSEDELDDRYQSYGSGISDDEIINKNTECQKKHSKYYGSISSASRSKQRSNVYCAGERIRHGSKSTDLESKHNFIEETDRYQFHS